MKVSNILKICISILLFTASNKLYSKTFQALYFSGEVSGQVFYDVDQNGIKSHFEKGISGVLVYLSNGQKSLTNSNGEYNIQVYSEEKNLKLHIENDTIPAGSKFTTPSNTHIIISTLNVFNINFGLYYPLTNHHFKIGKTTTKQHPPLVIRSKQKFKLSKKNNQFFIKDKPWFSLPNNHKEEKKNQTKENNYILKKYTLNHFDHQSPWDNEDLSMIIKKIKNAVDKLNKVILTQFYINDNKFSQEKAEIKANNIVIELKKSLSNNIIIETRLNIGNEKPIIEARFIKTNSNQLSIDYSCYFNLEELDPIILNDSSEIYFRYNSIKPQKFRIVCNEKEFFFSMKSSKDNLYIITSINNEHIPKFSFRHREKNLFRINNLYNYNQSLPSSSSLEIIHSKFISDSRDLDLDFEIISKNIESISINNIPFSGDKNIYTLKGNRRFNILKIEALTNNKKLHHFNYPIELKFDPKFIFKLEWQYHQVSVSSEFQATKYTLDPTPNISANMEYWFTSHWGSNLIISQDLIATELKTFTNESVYEKHSKNAIYLTNRFWNNYKDYFSSIYIFQIGMLKKDFATEQETLRIFTPKSFTALSSGLTYKKRNFLFPFIHLESKVFYSLSSQLNGDYLFETNHYIKFNLNKLGQVLQIPPSFRYYNRFFPCDRFNLLIGAGYEFFRVGIKKNAKGKLHEKNYHVNLGLEFSL